jgi:crotonobetainyl-CoA:carnitine CoA-transferase CaiB-like acyl-CoA transferase
MSSKSEKPQATGPLAGLRIVEWGTNFAVPLATMTLADQGAAVTKIEAPGGDATRHATAHRNGVKGLSASFVVANRNKRSLVLDMKKPGAVDVAKEIIAQADVFVQNFRPGVVDRLGVGYEAIREIKPDIIYVSVSGFGANGPYSRQRVFDPVVQAVSGMMASQADPETGFPSQMRSSVADKVTALVVSQAITAALLHHARTGEGQLVNIDMLSAALSFNWTSAMLNQTWIGEDVTLGANLRELRSVYPTKDGYICAIGISDSDWAALARALGRPELIEDPRFLESFDRLKNSKAIWDELGPTFLTRKSAHWLKLLAECDAVFAPVNGPETIMDDPQVLSASLVVEAEHPVAGRYRMTAHPTQFQRTPATSLDHPPLLGEHSDEILREIGLDDKQIARLRADLAVA